MAVPNTFTAVMYPMLVMGMQTWRRKSLLPLVANRKYEPEPGAKGSQVVIEIPSANTPNDVVPGHTAPDTGPLVPKTVTLSVDYWKEGAFTMTDRDLTLVNTARVLPQAAEQAVIGLANFVEATMLNEFLKVPYMNGTAGTTPFAPSATTGLSDMSVAINARKGLNQRDVPEEPRYAIVDSDAAGNLIQGRQLSDLSWRGDMSALRDANINRLLGAQFFESVRTPVNASTALTAGALTVNGVNAAGSATVSLAKATNPAPLLKGNTITIATGPAAGIYRVTADTTLIVGNTSVPITPVLRGATAGGEVVTLLASAVMNAMFHRDALAFVQRPFLKEFAADASVSYTDPETGLTLRLEIEREHKQWRWSYDILFGTGLPRPEAAQIMLG